MCLMSRHQYIFNRNISDGKASASFLDKIYLMLRGICKYSIEKLYDVRKHLVLTGTFFYKKFHDMKMLGYEKLFMLNEKIIYETNILDMQNFPYKI